MGKKEKGQRQDPFLVTEVVACVGSDGGKARESGRKERGPLRTLRNFGLKNQIWRKL